MFSDWLVGVDKKTKAHIRIGVCAFLWTIWNCRNDIVFNKTGVVHFLQVVYKASYWINLWSLLLPLEQRALMDSGCTRLMAVVRTIFNRGGWYHASMPRLVALIFIHWSIFVANVSMLLRFVNYSNFI